MARKFQTEDERQQIRTLFIDAARELFVARGIGAVTMREVASRTGYSATALYMHFADKEACCVRFAIRTFWHWHCHSKIS